MCDGWICGVAKSVASPEWFAGLLQVVVGALFALAAAVWILDRQVRHDRRLAREQHVAERAADIGWELRKIADSFDDLSAEAMGKMLRRQSRPPGERDLYEAARKLFDVTDDGEQVFSIWRERTHAWRALRAELAQLSADLGGELAPPVVGLAALEILETGNNQLERYARELIRGGGGGLVKEIPYVGLGMPSPREKAAYAGWRLLLRERFSRDVLKRLQAREAQ